MELSSLDIGIERHVDGAVLAAEDPELRRRPVLLQHGGPEISFDLGFIEADQPIDALRPDLWGLRRWHFDGIGGGWDGCLMEGLRARRWRLWRRHCVGRARLQ